MCCRNADLWGVSNCRVLGSGKSMFASYLGRVSGSGFRVEGLGFRD